MASLKRLRHGLSTPYLSFPEFIPQGTLLKLKPFKLNSLAGVPVLKRIMI